MGELIIGEHTYGTVARRGVMNNVIIGKYCSLAVNIVVDCGFNHDSEMVSTYPFKSQKNADCDHIATCKGDVIIGNDVWIGEDVTIMSGVNIGDGAIIGAKSLVTKSIPPYSIVGGVPVKLIRERFTESQINSLLKIKWWDWEYSKVIENVKLLNARDINKFIEIHG